MEEETEVVEALFKIADALQRLGTADASTPMGALEIISGTLQEGLKDIADGLSECATANVRIADSIEGLANATDIDTSLMGTWSETSILRKNASSGVGTVGSIDSSFYLSPDPDQFNAVYAAWSKNRTGSSIGSVAKVGSLAAITALIVAIGTAVKYAADMQRALNEKKSGAMAAAQNYGTVALEAKQSDFNDPKVSTSGSSNNTLIMLGLAAAGAYLLLDDEK